ncbi:MAG: hypothetical protein WBW04_06895 [Nitrolancea sp.]
MSVARPRAHHAKPTAVSPWSKLYGMGNVYAKTLRDSRIAIMVLAAILGLMLLATGADYGQAYATPQSRADFVNVVHELPTAVRGIYGDPFPANLSTLGGMVSLKIAASAALVACFWSILALSSTLASESRRGSLELIAVTPLSRRKLALEKLAAHVTSLAIVLAVLAAVCWLSGAVFGTLPGDAISAQASIGFAVWIGLMALASGSIAFALAPLFGRAGAAGIAGAFTVGGFLINGYQSAVPVFSGWSNVTWFGWTVHNQPLADQYNWSSLIPVALVAIVVFVTGVEIFARRDLGATTSIPWLRFPQATLGLRGPLGRSFGDRLPLALAWGAGLGLFGMVLGASAGSFSDSIGKTSQSSLDLFHRLFPGIDLTTAGGFLQLTFVEFGFIFAGFAAVTLIAGWASDELRGRFDLLLTAPLGRVKWAISSGLGVLAAIAIMTVVMGLGIGAGAAMVGSDALTPMIGTAVLGLYAAAIAGVGLALGSLIRPSIAATAAGVLVGLTFLLDLIAPGFKLPGWVHQIVLTSHLGQPMVGEWNWFGVAVCLLLALGGLAISAWGMNRRDVAR